MAHRLLKGDGGYDRAAIVLNVPARRKGAVPKIAA